MCAIQGQSLDPVLETSLGMNNEEKDLDSPSVFRDTAASLEGGEGGDAFMYTGPSVTCAKVAKTEDLVMYSKVSAEQRAL